MDSIGLGVIDGIGEDGKVGFEEMMHVRGERRRLPNLPLKYRGLHLLALPIERHLDGP